MPSALTPGLPEAIRARLCAHLVQLAKIVGILPRRVDIADAFRQRPIIELVDPLEGRKLDGLQRFLWSAAAEDLGPIEIIDRLCKRVAVAVAHTPMQWLGAGLNQALRPTSHGLAGATVARPRGRP
jgi:hypothetical protein